MARLKDLYRNEILPALKQELGYSNIMQVPELKKIVLNMGLGDAVQNAKILDSGAAELTVIAGQKPVITKAHQSIANFKLREGVPIGCSVILRGERMYEFFDRLINVALPRVRDFRGKVGDDFVWKGYRQFLTPWQAMPPAGVRVQAYSMRAPTADADGLTLQYEAYFELEVVPDTSPGPDGQA